MTYLRRPARINVKALVILVLVFALLGTGAVVGHYVRKRMMAADALSAGRAALDNEQWVEASTHLRQYLSKYPDDEEILEQYAKARLAIRPVDAGNVAAAAGAYRRLLRHRPGDGAVCKQLARIYFELARDFVECAYVCNQRLRTAPTDRDALYYLARSLQAQQKSGEARKQFEKLVAAHPGEVRSYAMLADLNLQAGASYAAEKKPIDWLNLAIEANPESGEALAQRGLFFLRKRNNASKAREDFEAAESLGMDNPSASLAVAGAWLDLGELDKARDSLAGTENVASDTLAAFDLMPDVFSFGRHLLRGRIALAGADRAECATVAEEALGGLSDQLRTRFRPVAVDLFLAAGRVAAARRAAEAYRTEKGDTTGSASNQLALIDAAVADAEGKPHAVIGLLWNLVRAKPNMGPASRLLWRALEKTGQTRRARQVLESYVAARQGAGTGLDPETLFKLASTYRNRDWVAVLRYASLAEQLRPGDLDSKLVRMEAELRGGAGRLAPTRIAELSRDASELQKAYPAHAGVRLVRALLTAGSDVDQAVADMEKAIVECDDVTALSVEVSGYYARKGEPEKAVAVLRAAKERTPSAATPRLALAELLASLDRAREARRTLMDAVDELSGDDEIRVRYALAQFMMSHDERETGVDMLRRLANDRPEDARVRQILLSLPETRADAEAAVRLIEQIREVEGDSGVRWRIEQAKLLLSSDMWMSQRSEIETNLQEVRRLDPEWTEPVLLLAELNQRLGRDAQAEELYRGALISAPDDVSVAVGLLKLLERQDRFTEASAVLDRFSGPTAELEVHRIGVMLGLGDFDSAMASLRSRVANDKSLAVERVVLAKLVYQHDKDFASAMQLLDEAEAASPNLITVPFSRATILAAEGRDGDALAVVNAQVARRQDFPALRMRARFHEAASEFDLAEQDYVRLADFEGRQVDGLVLLADFLFRHGRVADAIVAWDKGLAHDPNSLAVKRALTKGLVLSGDTEAVQRGIAMLDDLLQEFPDDAGFHEVRATALLNAAPGAWSEAGRQELERVVQLSPRNVSAHLRLIALASVRGDHARAMELTIRALGANGDNRQLALVRAGLEAQLGNDGFARQLAGSVFRADPENVTSALLLSELALRAGDPDEALRYAERALTALPESEAAQLVRANVLVAQEKRAEAVTRLETFRRTDAGGKSTGVLLVLSELYRLRGDSATASVRLAAAEKLAPDDVGVFLERVRLLAGRGRYDEIVAQVTRRRGSHPGEAQVLLVSARILVATGAEKYLRESQSLFEALASLNPSLMAARIGIAQSAYQLGDWELAENSYRAVLAAEPYNLQAMNDLAWILGVELDRVDEGLVLAERGANRYPDDPHLLDTYGELLALDGQLSEARESLEQCVATSIDNPRTHVYALFHLGRVYASQGERELARATLLDAQSVDGEHGVLAPKDRSEIDRLLKSVTP